MNHAAEKAVPAAATVFVQSVSQMTIADARNLLASESKTAATEYFRKTTTNQLTVQFLPIVKDATAKTGVTRRTRTFSKRFRLGARCFRTTHSTSMTM